MAFIRWQPLPLLSISLYADRNLSALAYIPGSAEIFLDQSFPQRLLPERFVHPNVAKKMANELISKRLLSPNFMVF
jgi:hypothetical protein